MRFPSFRAGRAWLTALVIPLALAACGPQKNQFAPACPVPGLLKPLDELTRYNGGSQDIRDLVARARIVNIIGKCEQGDNPNTVVATTQVVIGLTRGPAMRGQTIDLPVFVAITDANAIFDKTLFTLRVEFPPNIDQTQATTKEIRMEIPITPVKSAAAYGIIAGFQLTPDEVAAWRRNNRR